MTASVSSATVKGAYEPFDLQVARGQIFGHSTVNIYGFQSAVTTTKFLSGKMQPYTLFLDQL